MALIRAARAGDRTLGRVVQPAPPSQLHRRCATSRVRVDLLSGAHGVRSGVKTKRGSLQETQGDSRWTKPPRFRDREAPGSNPGPPTKNRIQIEVFACSVWRAGVTGRSQIFLELGGGSPVQVDFERQWNSVAAIAQPIY